MDSVGALALDQFEKFASGNTLQIILDHFNALCDVIQVEPTNLTNFNKALRETLTSSECRDLFSKYENRIKSKCYKNGSVCDASRVLIIGAGPCGLRTAIEAQLLGARVLLLEKRTDFSRKNVLHLWPFVMADLRELGAKKFCPKFCPGSIDHVSINQLQCILLKIALVLGVEVHVGIEFLGLVEPQVSGDGWRARSNAPSHHPINDFEFDVIIGADGRQNVLPGFKRKELRAKLAIAITANFLNRRTAAEAKVQEISGVSFIFRQSLFQNLCEETGIDLENIVYYKDETHYFVMTAKKQSLLWKGVLRENYADTDDLLAPGNIDMEALEAYTVEAVHYVTEGKLPNLEFALNHNGRPDLAIFDFTRMYAAENSCRVIERCGSRLLMGLVGDSLLEPFWPTGSGCARGFLSSLDAAWMIRSWATGSEVLDVLAERETIYRLLAQTAHDNLSKDFKNYNVDPMTRYPNLVTGTVKPEQVRFLYDSDLELNPIQKPEPDPVSSPSKRAGTKLSESPWHEQTPPTSSTLYRAGSETNLHPKPTDFREKERQEFDVDFLVEWLRQAVGPLGISVSGIHDIFVSGDVLCGTIHVFRPDLIPQYPFPPEIEEGIDVMDLAAFRNQIAFDFLHEEYGLPYVVSGYDSVQYTMTNLRDLVSYLFQVHSIFEDPNQLSSHARSFHDEQHEEDLPLESKPSQIPTRRKVARSATFSASDSDRERITARDFSNPRNGRCIRKLQERFQEIHFQPKESNEVRFLRRRDAEKCKLKAMEFMSSIQDQRSEAEAEAIANRRDRIIKTIRAVHVTQPESSDVMTTPSSTKEKDDFFNEYNLRLWRKSAPTMQERKGKLETAFSPQVATNGDGNGNGVKKRSKSPRKTASTTSVIASNGGVKVNTSDWVMELLTKKFPDAPPPSHQAQTNKTLEKTNESQAIETKSSENKNEETCFQQPIPLAEPLQFESVEFDNLILDQVPERVSYIPQISCPSTQSLESATSTQDHFPILEPSPSVEFDETDELLLDMMDPSELDQLEAWTGKYL